MAIRNNNYLMDFEDTGDFGQSAIEQNEALANIINPPAKPAGPSQEVIDALKKQILAQNLTGSWKGQGRGSAEANAADMARIMAGIGITDINQFGKVTQTIPAHEVMEGSGENAYSVTIPEQTVETYGNKQTGQAVPNTYSERQTGNAWGGTFEGSGNTGYRVQFGPDGTPYFYTTQASSNDLANLMQDLGPAFQIGLALATGGLSVPQQIAANMAVQVLSGQDVSTAIKNAAINMAVAQLPGTDLMKEGNKFIEQLGLDKTTTGILTKSFQNATISGTKALLSGNDVGDAMLTGAISGGTNGAVNALMNSAEMSELTKDMSATQKRLIANSATSLITGKPLDQVVLNAAIAAASAEAKEQAKYKPLDAKALSELTEDEKAKYDEGGPRALIKYQDEVNAKEKAAKDAQAAKDAEAAQAAKDEEIRVTAQREEAARIAKEEAARIAKEQDDARAAKAAADAKAAEAAAIAKAEEDARIAREEADRKALEAKNLKEANDARLAKEEADRKAKEAEEIRVTAQRAEDARVAEAARLAKEADDARIAKEAKDAADAAAAAEAAVKKKAEDDAAAAKKKAEEDAAAAKKKADDEVIIAAKRKADEDAQIEAARIAKEADDARIAKEAKDAADAAAAAAKKKADDDAAAAAAKKKAEDDEAARIAKEAEIVIAAQRKSEEDARLAKEQFDKEEALRIAREQDAAAKKKADDDAAAAKAASQTTKAVEVVGKKCEAGFIYDEDLKMCVPIGTTGDTDLTKGLPSTGLVGTGADPAKVADKNTVTVVGKKCEAGFIYDEDLKMCVPIAGTDTGTSKVVDTGKVTVTGKKETCPVGTKLNPVTGECDPYWDEGGGQTCPTGQTLDPKTGMCVPVSDKGTVTVIGKKETCPVGTKLNPVTGECDPYWDEGGGQTCPAGQTLDASTGLCVPVATTTNTCPTGQTWDAAQGKCVPVTTGSGGGGGNPVVKKAAVSTTPSFTPQGGYTTSSETIDPIYAGEMGDFNLYSTLEDILADTSGKKDNTNSRVRTKMATGGHLDDLLGQQMSVDDLLNLLR